MDFVTHTCKKCGCAFVAEDYTNEQRKNAERKRLNTLRKKVLCVETNIIYISISHAAKATGLYVQNICRCCKGKLKQTGGYHWQYAN